MNACCCDRFSATKVGVVSMADRILPNLANILGLLSNFEMYKIEVIFCTTDEEIKTQTKFQKAKSIGFWLQ